MLCTPTKKAPFINYAMQGALRVAFLNGESQSFPLQAVMNHPALRATFMTGQRADSVDFGRVHVQSRKVLDVLITNFTTVDAEWHLEQELPDGSGRIEELQLQSMECKTGKDLATGAFTFSPSEGIIRGEALVRPAPLSVRITFAPQRAEHYWSKITMAVKSGEACAFEVQGVGTLDECDECQGALATLYQ
jgi:hypothetical protein